MRILVTGGAGFIGSAFIRCALNAGGNYCIVNFDKLTYAGNLENLADVENHPGYRFVKGDICSPEHVLSAMTGCDAVVHFAAESHVDRSIFEPGTSIQTNVLGTSVLLRAAKELQIARFVHVSTDEVYGDMPPDVSACESFPLLPNSPYSASKASSDLLVRSFVKTFGMHAIVTRASNNYGPRQFPEKFIPLMICNALDNKPLPLYGDGLQERDWLHVEDHCRGLLRVLADGRPGGTYNIGGGSVESNIDVVKKILDILGKPQSLIKHVTDRPGHDRRYSLDCTKISRELGWKPSVPFDLGLAQTVQWYLENRQWIVGVRNGDYALYYDRNYHQREAAVGAAVPAKPTW